MKIPLSWLREYIDIDWDVEKIASELTMSGNNVEDVYRAFDLEGKIVVGRVENVEKHPNSDRLLVCRVNTGDKGYTVVAGDPTMKVGDIVPLALEGAKLHTGLVVKPLKIKGVLSEAMMCSLEELGLEEKSETIYRFKEDIPLGTDIIAFFKMDEPVLDVEVTPNRPDCLSVIGIARELSVLSGVPYRRPEPRLTEGEEETSDVVKVIIEDTEGCTRYTAKVVKGVEVKDSPFWMKVRLVASGVRSINTVVDATNYVMLETGHPVHAFDLNLLKKGTIVVRKARPGEKVVLLDEKEYTLKGGETLITDGESIIAVGGIMGAENSGIKEDTKDVLLEVAHFDHVRIRRSRKNLGINTESSYRFERGVDPENNLYVMERLVELIQKLSGGIATEGVVDVIARKVERRKILVRKERVEKILGKKMESGEIERIFKGLEISFERVEKGWEVLPPSFRPDLEREIDLIEEIGRIHGYDKIPSQPLSRLSDTIGWDDWRIFRRDLEELMKAHGFDQVVTFSFVDSEKVEKVGLMDETVKLLNPISSDLDVMRPSLFYSLMDVLSGNYKRQNKNVKLFEIGKVFSKKGKNIVEVEKLGAIAVGLENPEDYTDRRNVSFYSLKGVIDDIFERMGVNARYIPSKLKGFFDMRTAKITVGDEEIGFLGMVDPGVLDMYDVKDEVYFFEINLETLYRLRERGPKYEPTPKFPYIRRDVSFLVPFGFESSRVIEELKRVGKDLVEKVGVSDVYKGKGIPQDHISVTFYVIFRSKDRTLTDDEVNDLFQKMVESVEKNLAIKKRY